MTDQILNDRLRRLDPVDPGTLPTATETEAALDRWRRVAPSWDGAAARPPARRRRRPRLIVGGTTAAAALLAVALALLFSASTSPPAFAVTHHADGTITVKLLKLSGITGANQKLAALGVRAKVVRKIEVARVIAGAHPCLPAAAAATTAVSFNPRSIPRRRVLVLAADPTAHLSPYAGTVQPIQLKNAPAGRQAVNQVRRAKALAAKGAHAPLTGSITVYGSAGKVKISKGTGVGANQVVQIMCARALVAKPAR